MFFFDISPAVMTGFRLFYYFIVRFFGGGCCILTFDPAQNAIQGDAPEGSDTFQWQLGEEIA